MVETIEFDLSLNCHSIKDLPEIARKILKEVGRRGIIAFDGELGSGKTTLIRQICMEIGVEDSVSSPSFSIINEYLDDRGEPVYHFDFYRINNKEEAMDIGAQDYFYSGNLCLVEWPARVIDLIPAESIFVKIEVTGPESRIFHLKKHD